MRLLVTRRMTAAAEAAIAEAFDVAFRDSTVPLTEAEAAAALSSHDAIMPTLGDRFTAADILIAHTLTWALAFELPLEHDYLKTYAERLLARPTWVRVQEREQAEQRVKS